MRLAVLLALLPAIAVADPDQPGATTEVDAGAATLALSYQGRTRLDPGLAFHVAFGRYLTSDLVTSLELSDTIFLHAPAYEMENAFAFGLGAQLRVHSVVVIGASVGLTRGSVGIESAPIVLNGWNTSERVGYVLSRSDRSELTASLAFTHTWLASGYGSINAVAVLIGYRFL